MKRIVTGSINFLLILCCLDFVYSAVYYVSQREANSSDENPGTEEKPYETISRACEMTKAGDTVIIKPGIYREAIIPKNSGEEGSI